MGTLDWRRCGGLPPRHAIFSEKAAHKDVVCVPTSASVGRSVGGVMALWHWLSYAALTFPKATFICRADDDVWLHLADIEMRTLMLCHTFLFPVTTTSIVLSGPFTC